MPGSTRTFSYTLTPPPDDVDKTIKQAKRVLGWACDGDARVECHDVTGEAFGRVTLNVTVHGRDRWATTQIVQDVLNYIVWGLGHPTDVELDLQSQRLEPHENRGYQRGNRTKRYREPRPPKQPGPVDPVAEG